MLRTLLNRRSLIGAAVLALLAGLIPVVAAQAADTSGTVTLSDNTANVTTLSPGDSITYEFKVACDGGGCDGTKVVYTVDPRLTIDSVVATLAGTTVTTAIDNATHTASMQADLPPSATPTWQVVAHLDANTPYVASPPQASGTVDAVYGGTASNTTTPVDVDVTIPLHVAASLTKTITPAQGIKSPGSTSQVTLTATNGSNTAADKLVFQEPAQSVLTAGTSPYATYLAIDQLSASDYSSLSGGTVTVEYDVAGSWTTTYSASALGVRVTATGLSVAAGATRAITIPIEQTSAVSAISSDTVLSAAASAVASVGATDSSTATASASYTIGSGSLAVSGTVSFAGSVTAFGGVNAQTTMTITGRNDSDKVLDTLELLSRQDSAPFFWKDGITPTAWASVTWPSGATAADVTFDYRDASNGLHLVGYAAASDSQYQSTTANTLPAISLFTTGIDSSWTLTGIDVTFSGALAVGAVGTVRINITAPDTTSHTDDDPVMAGFEWESDLQINSAVTSGAFAGSTGTATASGELVYNPAQVKVDKAWLETVANNAILANGTLYDVAGSGVIVQHTGRLAASGTDLNTDSTVGATSYTITDSANGPSGSSAWWDAFTVSEIPKFTIPSSYTLEVDSFDGSSWTTVETVAAGASPYYAFSSAQQSSMRGIRFVWTYLNGANALIPPGTTLSSVYYTAALRSDVSAGSTYTDHVVQTAANDNTGVNSTDSLSTLQDTVTANAVPSSGGGGGAGAYLGIGWASAQHVYARSQQQYPSIVDVDGLGQQGLTQAVVTEALTADGTPTANVAQSFFDAHDLVAIHAYNPNSGLRYDKITKIELFDGSSWVDSGFAGIDGLTGSGDTTIYTLTSAQQSWAIGARIYLQPSGKYRDANADVGTAPSLASGLAADQQLWFVYRLRDDLRSNASTPVVGTTLDTSGYNSGVDGKIVDQGYLRLWQNGEDVASSPSMATGSASATITITDDALRADLTQDWAGGPLAVPPASVPATSWPTTRTTLTAANTTPNGSKADGMTMVAAATPTGSECVGAVTTSPFEIFNLKQIVSVTAPAGTTNTIVRLDRSGTTTDYTIAQAEALTESQLADVTGLTVLFSGRLTSYASLAGAGSNAAQVVYDMRLRQYHRSSGTTPVTVSDAPACSSASAQLLDQGGHGSTSTATALDDSDNAYWNPRGDSDQISLTQVGIGVTPTIAFSPSTITENSNDTSPVTVTLTGRPASDPVNGASSRAVSLTLTEDDPDFWKQYDLTTLPTETASAPADTVQTLVKTVDGDWVSAGSIPNADVVGVRFTFTKSDGTYWENPQSPIETGTFTVTRRSVERNADGTDSTTPVYSDRVDNPAGPNASAGVTDTSVTADIVGSDLGTDSLDPITGNVTANVKGEASTAATLRYHHATNALTVTKTVSAASISPSDSFSYTLKVKNTGAANITGVVVTDTMPVDGSSEAAMRLDPSVDDPYTYSLGGDDEPTVTPTIDASQNLSSVVFTFPAGDVLEPGGEYDITIAMTTRPGLAAGSYANNIAVANDHPLDTCNGTTRSPATTATCGATASVTVASAIAASSQTFVKALTTGGYADLGALSTSGTVTCGAPNGTGASAGWYTTPCVPLTAFGQTERWRKVLTNAGNISLGTMTGYDMVTKVGDTGPKLTAQRGTAWNPVLATIPTATMADGSALPSGATFEVDYSTTCSAPLNAGCSSWAPLTDASVLPSVKALRYAFTFPAGMAGAAAVAVSYDTTTPDAVPSAAASTTDPIAWGAVGQQAVQQGSSTSTAFGEGTKVGIAFATTAVKLNLNVTGTYPMPPGTTFPMALICTQPGESTPLTLASATGALADDGSYIVSSVPVGATCQAGFSDDTYPDSILTTDSATATRGVTHEVDATVTIDSGASVKADYTVSSNITDPSGNHLDVDGTNLDTTTLTGDYDCTFGGAQIATGDLGTGLVPAHTAALVVGALPSGSVCVITPDDPAIAPLTVTATTTGGVAHFVKNVAVAHHVVTVTKSVAGTQQAWIDLAHVAFPMALTCKLGTTVVKQVTTTLEDGDAWPVAGIPAGASCELTETTTYGADSVAISGDATASAPTVTFTVNADKAITVTNTINTPPTLAVSDPTAGSVAPGDDSIGDLYTDPTTPGASPVLEYSAAQPPAIDVTSFPGADSATYQIAPAGGGTILTSGSLTESSTTPGSYPLSPSGLPYGRYTVTVTLTFNGQTVTKTFDIYIDPAGTVRDAQGHPVDGATVTLWYHPALGTDGSGNAICLGLGDADMTMIPDPSALLSPANPHSTETTGADGVFSWLTATGCFQVRAQKTVGASTFDGETPIVGVAPEHLDLGITLGGLNPPPPPPVTTSSPSPSDSATGTPSDGSSPTSSPTSGGGHHHPGGGGSGAAGGDGTAGASGGADPGSASGSGPSVDTGGTSVAQGGSLAPIYLGLGGLAIAAGAFLLLVSRRRRRS